jgi:4-hydroxy-3-polyprenylbenzoate decarboxylase
LAGVIAQQGRDLRGFRQLLERLGQLRRISAPVDPNLELSALADRVVAMGGPALLFETVIGSKMPVAVNLLGTVERVVWSMGMERAEELEILGAKLTLLQQTFSCQGRWSTRTARAPGLRPEPVASNSDRSSCEPL